jgi:hypothetical protein
MTTEPGHVTHVPSPAHIPRSLKLYFIFSLQWSWWNMSSFLFKYYSNKPIRVSRETREISPYEVSSLNHACKTYGQTNGPHTITNASETFVTSPCYQLSASLAPLKLARPVANIFSCREPSNCYVLGQLGGTGPGIEPAVT